MKQRGAVGFIPLVPCGLAGRKRELDYVLNPVFRSIDPQHPLKARGWSQLM